MAINEIKNFEFELHEILDNSIHIGYINISETKTEASDNTIVVEYDIIWGDWKHDHLRSEYLIKEFMAHKGYELVDSHEDITEDNESDTYSAIHKLFFI